MLSQLPSYRQPHNRATTWLTNLELLNRLGWNYIKVTTQWAAIANPITILTRYHQPCIAIKTNEKLKSTRIHIIENKLTQRLNHTLQLDTKSIAGIVAWYAAAQKKARGLNTQFPASSRLKPPIYKLITAKPMLQNLWLHRYRLNLITPPEFKQKQLRRETPRLLHHTNLDCAGEEKQGRNHQMDLKPTLGLGNPNPTANRRSNSLIYLCDIRWKDKKESNRSISYTKKDNRLLFQGFRSARSRSLAFQPTIILSGGVPFLYDTETKGTGRIAKVSF